MADHKAERLNHRESTYRRMGEVQVFTRRDDQNRPTLVDAIDENKGQVESIADRLHRLGYGVMRRRKPRAGRVYTTLKARWVGPGEPPEDPLAD